MGQWSWLNVLKNERKVNELRDDVRHTIKTEKLPVEMNNKYFKLW